MKKLLTRGILSRIIIENKLIEDILTTPSVEGCCVIPGFPVTDSDDIPIEMERNSYEKNKDNLYSWSRNGFR